jgi:uracil-DNA glycosylase
MNDSLAILNQEIVACKRCARLLDYCRRIGEEKRRAYRDWDYWAKPVPSFGDPEAALLIVGLAPGAHGANRTGRMFTGDSSGDFLYRALYENGFTSQPTSTSRGDGLELRDAYISAAAHCAPPDNKPASAELRACGAYLRRELDLLKNLRVVVALGRIAFDSYLRILPGRPRLLFAHNRAHELGSRVPLLISSYHPSRQNTSTGRLTAGMLSEVFAAASAARARHVER